MKYLILMFLFGGLLHAADGRKPVDTRLAKMVERVAVKTGLSLNVSASGLTWLEINSVGGRPVSDPLNFQNVKVLQEAFEADADCFENFGPAVYSMHEKSKKNLAMPGRRERFLDRVRVSVKGK